MSADDYTYVGKVNERQFGIFLHCSASEDGSPWTLPDEIIDDPVTAIIRAHRIERNDATEYGVVLGKGVLDDAELVLALRVSFLKPSVALGGGSGGSDASGA